jgi:DNA (cytosine-5)-methyltransferase 1
VTTIGSLCSGYGGLDLGVELAIGPVRHAWHAEVDPEAAAVLAGNWPGVPNLGDITKVDWDQVPRVDILTAGYPCQPFSNAGLRKGEQDDRNRWPDVARAVRELRPGLVVLENVRGHLRRGFGTVVTDLAGLGYVGSWTCVRASDAGAAHKRERIVIVARPAADTDGLDLRHEPGWSSRPGGQGPAVAGDAGQAHRLSLLPTPSARDGRRGMGWGDQPGRPLSETVMRLLPTPRASDGPNGGPNQRGRRGDLALPSVVVQHADRWGDYGPAIARWEAVTGRPAPEPTTPGRLGQPRLSPLFVEWLMGLDEGHVTKHVERRPAALRILGNGVVPQQAELALRQLLGGAQ